MSPITQDREAVTPAPPALISHACSHIKMRLWLVLDWGLLLDPSYPSQKAPALGKSKGSTWVPLTWEPNMFFMAHCAGLQSPPLSFPTPLLPPANDDFSLRCTVLPTM